MAMPAGHKVKEGTLSDIEQRVEQHPDNQIICSNGAALVCWKQI